jgi:hypothetical protein
MGSERFARSFQHPAASSGMVQTSFRPFHRQADSAGGQCDGKPLGGNEVPIGSSFPMRADLGVDQIFVLFETGMVVGTALNLIELRLSGPAEPRSSLWVTYPGSKNVPGRCVRIAFFLIENIHDLRQSLPLVRTLVCCTNRSLLREDVKQPNS